MLKLLLLGEIKQKEILNLYNSEINYINLPQRINGFTFYYKGINSIYINQNLSDPKKLETLLHEISFIELNNFYYLQKKTFSICIQGLNDEADKYLLYLNETLKKEMRLAKESSHM